MLGPWLIISSGARRYAAVRNDDLRTVTVSVQATDGQRARPAGRRVIVRLLLGGGAETIATGVDGTDSYSHSDRNFFSRIF
jgi:hypothetical protein